MADDGRAARARRGGGLAAQVVVGRSLSISDAYMLERLDTINWSAVHHAHGEASDVPILLRKTLSHIKEERDYAFQLLHETIWHQGTVYEASAHVVPFLWEMIQSPETPDKPSVAFLLASLADGHPYLKAHAFYSKESEERFRKFLAKDGLELEEEMAKEERWVAETREAVRQGLPLLYPYLERGDSHMKWCVAQALACYPEHAQETVPLLEEALKDETNKHTAKELRETIAKLKAGSSSKDEHR